MGFPSRLIAIMTQPHTDDINKIDQAWEELEECIHSLGKYIRTETHQEDALHRYEGYKTLLSMLGENYISQLYADRKTPEFAPFLGTIFNYAGPSPDMLYYLVQLDPEGTYRVWGNRGDASLIDFQQLEGWYGQNAEKLAAATISNKLFDEMGIDCDEQGDFDFILSNQKHDGQWCLLGDGCKAIVIREYFTDYATQTKPSSYHIDRLDKVEGHTCPSADEGAERIKSLTRALSNYRFALSMSKMIIPNVGYNQFHELNFSDAGAASDQRYLQACFDIKEDQALVGKWIVPEKSAYWSAALYNDFYQMLNYANRQTNFSPDMAEVSGDRILYFVMSHKDTGIANWLDVDGHNKGQILIRTKGASGFELPSLELVNINELNQHLPADIARVTPEQRQSDLAIRRKHFQLRERR